MAFREIMEGIILPDGASKRFRTLTALGMMLDGTLYQDIEYSFDQEKRKNDGGHIPMRERRPSHQFSLAYELTQDTLAELFGDESFPIVQAIGADGPDDDATSDLADLIENLNIDDVMANVYEEGVIGAAAVVLHRSPEGEPFYDVLPGKWCEPVYSGDFTNKKIGLIVTYPVPREVVDKAFPGYTDKVENQDDNYWYRYIVGPIETVDYWPLTDRKFQHLGEKDDKGEIIEFVERKREDHGFKGRAPIVYTKNFRDRRREMEGPALWWPIVDNCVDLDYDLSQTSRGLRYTADPMLFIKRGEMFGGTGGVGMPAGYQQRNEAPAGGMATTTGSGGEMVKGATQTLVGGPNSDAKLLEISGNGIKELREFIRDVREYSLEVVGGMKARSEHVKGAASGKAIDKQSKPLRRLVRRQRRPYGNALLEVVDLTLYGYRVGAFDANPDVNIAAIDENAKRNLEWPNDEVLQGSDLLDHVTGLQLAGGGSVMNPLQLISPEAIGTRMAADLGFHQPYDTIKGTAEPLTPPVDPNAAPDPAPAG